MAIVQTITQTADPSDFCLPLESMGYSIRRYYIDAFFMSHIPGLEPTSVVLDLGGNKSQKRGAFNIGEFDLEVIYLNVSIEKKPDVRADALQLPFKDCSFDAVICAEVYEHLYKPDLALNEMYRVLKPGGKIFLTIPFLVAVHSDPHDYGRYTEMYWSKKLPECGFDNILIERQGLFYSTIVEHIKHYIHKIETRFLPKRWIVSILPSIQRWAIRRDQRPDSKDNGYLNNFTLGYGINAVKPGTDHI